MKTFTEDFIEAMLFAYNWEDSEYNEEDVSIYDIDADSAAHIEAFIDSFLNHLYENHEVLYENIDQLERTFGGNVYFTLSGHGCGFFDEPSELDQLDLILRKFSGNPYLFEELELVFNADTGYYSINNINA